MNIVKSVPWKFYGVWMLPLCGIMGVAMHGTQTYGWPVLFPVITKEFGWSAAVAATASSLARFEGGFEAPLAGWIMDKYGTRITFLFGGLMMGIGWILLSFVTPDNILFYFIAFGVIVQTGGNVGGYSSGYKTVANWWIRRRARATAAFVLPVGLAGTFSPMIVAASIAAYGWRTTLIYLGIFCFALFIPAGIFIRPHKPEYYGLLPDGDDPKKVQIDAAAADKKAAEEALMREAAKKQADFRLGDAMKTQAFWVINIGAICNGFSFNTVNLFVPSLLVANGFDLPTAAFYAGMMLTFSYLGRLTLFIFGDSVSPKYLTIFSWAMLGLGAGALAFTTPSTSYLAWVYASVYGWGYGLSPQIASVLKMWAFGRAQYATIAGVMSTIAMVGGLLGPTVVGWTFDTTGTYVLGFQIMAIVYFVGAVSQVILKRPVAKSTPATAPSAA